MPTSANIVPLGVGETHQMKTYKAAIFAALAFMFSHGDAKAFSPDTSLLCIANTTATTFKLTFSSSTAAFNTAGASLDNATLGPFNSICASFGSTSAAAGIPIAPIALSATALPNNLSISWNGTQGSTTVTSGYVSANAPYAPFKIYQANGQASSEIVVNTYMIRNDYVPPLSSWMSQLDGNLRLSQVILPGAHDAGMYTITRCESSEQSWALTQNFNIGLQLEYGVRYFDLRPGLVPPAVLPSTVSLGDFAHSHFSGGFASAGCWGDTMDNIINYVTQFMANNPGETVILDFTHTQYGVPSINGVQPQTVANAFQPLVQKALGGYLLQNFAGNLASFPLAAMRGKVITLWEGYYGTNIANGVFPDYAGNPGMNIYNQYSSTNDVGVMQPDQQSKLSQQAFPACSPAPIGSPGLYQSFLLSWTLTAQPSDLVFDISAIAPGALGTLLAQMSSIAAGKAMGTNAAPNSTQPTQPVNVGQVVQPQIVLYDFVDPYLTQGIIQANNCKP